MTYDKIRGKIASGFYGYDTPNWAHTSVQDSFRRDVKTAAGIPDRPDNDHERNLYGAYIHAYSVAWNLHRRNSWESVLDKFVTVMQDRGL